MTRVTAKERNANSFDESTLANIISFPDSCCSFLVRMHSCFAGNEWGMVNIRIWRFVLASVWGWSSTFRIWWAHLEEITIVQHRCNTCNPSSGLYLTAGKGCRQTGSRDAFTSIVDFVLWNCTIWAHLKQRFHPWLLYIVRNSGGWFYFRLRNLEEFTCNSRLLPILGRDVYPWQCPDRVEP